ncbi:putative DUF234 domain protein [Campylobacter iguaniorum]|uniref:DUF234 domain-containing protein n=1 Tax=Campylobacter iguaniorum TaxID=1244531 RepID=UPI0007C980C2|nr:DUF234 domain-containing protein [Campylobacter iguaniorum]ANE36232.1 putative DUF234 domain protein [Campylobacter iguaniorum]
MQDLDAKEHLEYYFVFGNSPINTKYPSIFEAINCEILQNYKEFQSKFKLQIYPKESVKLLTKLAKSDRKCFNLTKNIPRKLATQILNELIGSGLIQIEKSKEPKPFKSKHQKLKKELRHYQIQDKIHFKDNLARFWFRFCQPNLELLEAGKFDEVLSLIKSEFEMYCSLPFELASIRLLAHHLNIPKNAFTSYWTKDDEIDIFSSIDDFIVVGEVKYKDRKICKNVLNLLKFKCEKIGIKPNLIALFSKSGFSNELLNLKDDTILLFDIDDFKDIL